MEIKAKFDIGDEVYYIDSIFLDDLRFTKGNVVKIQIEKELLYQIRYSYCGSCNQSFKQEKDLFSSFEELEKFALIEQNKMIKKYLEENLSRLKSKGIEF